MDALTWNFPDSAYASRCVAAGFEAYGQGVEISSILEFDDDEAILSVLNSYEYETELEIPPNGTACVLVVHYVCSGASALDPDNLTFTFNGQAMVAEAQNIQTTEVDSVEAIAYLWIGDSSDLDAATLTVAVSGVSGVVPGLLSVQVVTGIQDAEPEIFWGGTVDVYAATITLDLEPTDPDIVFGYVFSGAGLHGFTGSITLTDASNEYELIVAQSDSATRAGTAYAFCDVSYNCDCDVEPDARTLAQMRTTVLSLSGYAAQASNPGPGINTKFNAFIDLAQKYVYSKVRAMNTSRMFTWQLRPGVRYYGLADTTNCCNVLLNRYRIEGAWIQDLNNVWWPLVYGIDPTGYTLDSNFGWPTNFMVRQCVEVFPAPQAAYKLRIQAHFNLLPLEDDTDTTTIPSTPVLNWAVFLAKSDKGHKDAALYKGMCDAQIDDMIAGRHVTRRYIPGTAEIPVPTPPIMVRYDN